MSGVLKVWSKFRAASNAGNVFNLQIVEMPEYLAEDVIELYMNYFVKGETTFKAAGIPTSAEAMEELRVPILKSTKEKEFNIAICCLDNGDNEINNIIGASKMALKLKDEVEPKFHPKTEELKKLFELFDGMESYYDEKKEFNLDRYFTDRGVFVHPDYRGLGIAQQLLKVRRMICKEHGIPVHGAWMTSYGTQIAAERDGWETVCEFQYVDFGKKHGVTTDGPPTSKFMIARIA